jgi:4-hydroxy-3-polyprenylbenzoate decarboxylase
MGQKRKIVIAITGASGSIYGKDILEKLKLFKNEIEEAGIIFSNTGKEVWKYEIGKEIKINKPFKLYKDDDFYAPFASGSAGYDTMIICPCSMGTIGRIANGISDDLITRTADVMLKERKKLILVPREAPYNLIHINNMKLLTEAGAIIYPASPSFYGKPKNIDELIGTVTGRVISLAGFDIDLFKWGKE